MHAKVYDRTEQPVVYRSLGKTSDERLSRIYFIVLYFFCRVDRLQLTAVYCNRRGCKDNTSKDPFSHCEQLQGIHIQVKSEYVGTLMTTDLMTQSRTTSTTTCSMWPQTWSMCTLTRTTTEDSWVPVVSMIPCAPTVAQVGSRLKFVPCSSHRHRHVSCARWVTRSSTSPSSLSFSSSSSASSTSFCSSPSLR